MRNFSLSRQSSNLHGSCDACVRSYRGSRCNHCASTAWVSVDVCVALLQLDAFAASAGRKPLCYVTDCISKQAFVAASTCNLSCLEGLAAKSPGNRKEREQYE